MKTYQRSGRVNVAIKEGLRRCQQLGRPFDTLMLYMAELRVEESWSEADLDVVESALRDILAPGMRVN